MTTTTAPTRPGVAGATEALDRYLAGRSGDGSRPSLRYLRRKPGRGLVAIFGPNETGEIYTVALDEQALNATTDARQPSVPTIQEFPDDPKLPQLADVMAPAGELIGALESAARRLHDVPAGEVLLGVSADAVRYKPGDRCVIRYRLRFGDPDRAGDVATRSCGLVAKLYRSAQEAEAADDLLTRLRAAALPWTARPLGVVAGLPLALTEDLGSSRERPPTRSGLRVVHPGSSNAFEVVRGAARALAELHTSGVDTGNLGPRTGMDEAGKAAKRAGQLVGYVPELTPTIHRVAEELCATLERLPEDTLRPGHGSYKPSQLLVRRGEVFLVDFDQFCPIDPALDVGYFLAYLRPAGLWYRRAGRRAWFDSAAEAFRSAYFARLTERGESADTCAGIARRAPAFEAALLFKIAARRVNRLHSPRPGEVAAVLDEAAGLLNPPG